LRHQVNALRWVLFGWVGTLLVGSQVMKLIMEGIRLIYGDQERHSFIGRQFRGMLLFCVTIVGWMMAVALSVFSHPLRQWMTLGFSQSAVVRGFWNIMLPIMGLILAMLVLALIYRFARPSATTWVSVLPGASAATILWWGLDIWSLRPKDAVWISLRYPRRGDRLDGVDGTLGDDRLSGRGLERGKHPNGEPVMTKKKNTRLSHRKLIAVTCKVGHSA
jgi:Virulence factor BrkB